MSVTYNKITDSITEILHDCEKVGYVERIGNMYSIEVQYHTLNLPTTQRKLIKGIVERLIVRINKRKYKEMVKRYQLRNSKLYGKKYTKYFILDGSETETELKEIGCDFRFTAHH